jgi:hypothetical protein
MELHAHKWLVAVANAFVGAVVGVEEPRLPIRRRGFIFAESPVPLPHSAIRIYRGINIAEHGRLG